MSKEVTYSVVARKNMLKKDDPAKYYAQAGQRRCGAGRDLDPGGKGLYGTFGGCRGSAEGAGG